MDGWRIGEAGAESVCAVDANTTLEIRCALLWKCTISRVNDTFIAFFYFSRSPSISKTLRVTCMHSECTQRRETFNSWRHGTRFDCVALPHGCRKQKAKQDSYFSYADWFLWFLSAGSRALPPSRDIWRWLTFPRGAAITTLPFFSGDESFSAGCSWRGGQLWLSPGPRYLLSWGRKSIGIPSDFPLW